MNGIHIAIVAVTLAGIALGAIPRRLGFVEYPRVGVPITLATLVLGIARLLLLPQERARQRSRARRDPPRGAGAPSGIRLRL